MNLNGEKSKPSGTILNGKPLVYYDHQKNVLSRRHSIWHRKSTLRSRTYIGNEKLGNARGRAQPKQARNIKVSKANKQRGVWIIRILMWFVIIWIFLNLFGVFSGLFFDIFY